VPLFSLPFMRSVKGLSRGTLTSDSATVEVVPVLSAGSSATLRDIKEPAPAGKPEPLALALGVLALSVAGWLTWRARRRAPTAVAEPLPAPAAAPATRDPYDVATDRLMAIERERWGASDVARHYAEVTNVLRDYLEAYGVPARERTTSELRWTLAPGLLAGRGLERFETVFDAADLVKFARLRPGARTRRDFWWRRGSCWRHGARWGWAPLTHMRQPILRCAQDDNDGRGAESRRPGSGCACDSLIPSAAAPHRTGGPRLDQVAPPPARAG